MPDNPFAFDPPPNVNPNDFPTPPVWSPNERPDARWQFTKTEYDRIMAALEQHGILNTNSTIDSPHPDQAVHTLTFGASGGKLGDEGIVLDDASSISWREDITKISSDTPRATLSADLGGTTTDGADIVLRGTDELDNTVTLELTTGDGVSGAWDMRLSSSTVNYSRLTGDDTEVVVRHGNATLLGRVAIDGDWAELTIATGVITVTSGRHVVDTQSDAGTDDLDTISGGMDGQILVLAAANTARDVVLTEAGNLKLAGGSFTLDNTEDTIMLVKKGSNWLELCRSNNGA